MGNTYSDEAEVTHCDDEIEPQQKSALLSRHTSMQRTTSRRRRRYYARSQLRPPLQKRGAKAASRLVPLFSFRRKPYADTDTDTDIFDEESGPTLSILNVRIRMGSTENPNAWAWDTYLHMAPFEQIEMRSDLGMSIVDYSNPDTWELPMWDTTRPANPFALQPPTEARMFVVANQHPDNKLLFQISTDVSVESISKRAFQPSFSHFTPWIEWPSETVLRFTKKMGGEREDVVVYAKMSLVDDNELANVTGALTPLALSQRDFRIQTEDIEAVLKASWQTNPVLFQESVDEDDTKTETRIYNLTFSMVPIVYTNLCHLDDRACGPAWASSQARYMFRWFPKKAKWFFWNLDPTFMALVTDGNGEMVSSGPELVDTLIELPMVGGVVLSNRDVRGEHIFFVQGEPGKYTVTTLDVLTATLV